MKQESKQDGISKEQPKEEISKETPKPVSTDEKKTSGIENTAEFKNIQSQKDKADARAIKAERAVESMQKQLQEFRQEMENQRQADRKRQIDNLADDPDKQKELMAKFDFEDWKAKEMAGIDMAWGQVADLMVQHNLPTSAIAELRKATNPAHMAEIARRLAAEQEKGVPPSNEPDWTPDSNTSNVGSRRTWTAKEIEDMPIEEYRANKAAIEQAQREGHIK